MDPQFENNLPDSSKVWIYQSSRKLSDHEASQVEARVKNFVSQWNSHKVSIAGDGKLLHNYFVILMADESQAGVSGCSIDSTVHFIKSLGQEFNTNFFDRWNLAYIKDGEVVGVHRDDFDRLLNTGKINDDTIVFNNLLHNKGDFKTKWQVTYRQSWLKNLKVAHLPFNSVL